MVVFIDLDSDPAVEPPELNSLNPNTTIHWLQRDRISPDLIVQTSSISPEKLEERVNPNKNAVTEALGCYPVICEIASFIDLNTLDNLSRTCRQVRENLLQFRKQLIMRTLRCSNDDVVPNHEHTLRYRARAADWYFVEEGAANFMGKVGSCARDMVSECRRCSRVVCRNCTIKPPAPVLLRHRHRRLCPTCIRTPLARFLSPNASSSFGSQPLSVKSNLDRAICLCPTEGVWLCQPCGRGLRSADTTYESIWRWRTSYGPALGGLGTGIGEGNRSSECGRAAECLAAKLVEEEIDCDAEDARQRNASQLNEESIIIDLNGNGTIGGSNTPRLQTVLTSNEDSTVPTGMGQLGPGYARHEIEGIGGVVKRKLVKMVWVGACVTEWEDEKNRGRYLVREVEGRTRSWCGWCCRVIPGARDKGEK